MENKITYHNSDMKKHHNHNLTITDAGIACNDCNKHLISIPKNAKYFQITENYTFSELSPESQDKVIYDILLANDNRLSGFIKDAECNIESQISNELPEMLHSFETRIALRNKTFKITEYEINTKDAMELTKNIFHERNGILKGYKACESYIIQLMAGETVITTEFGNMYSDVDGMCGEDFCNEPDVVILEKMKIWINMFENECINKLSTLMDSFQKTDTIKNILLKMEESKNGSYYDINGVECIF